MKLEDVAHITTKRGITMMVRRLRLADQEALRLFGNALSRETTARFLPHLYDAETLEPLLYRSERGDDFALGVFQNDRIVGYFFLHHFKRSFPLLGIGILDDFQGAGLGRQMMRLLIDEAMKNGNDGIDLTTLPANNRAFKLYLSVGFRHIGFVENRRSDGGVTVERALRYMINPQANAPSVLANGREVKTMDQLGSHVQGTVP